MSRGLRALPGLTVSNEEVAVFKEGVAVSNEEVERPVTVSNEEVERREPGG